MLIVDTIILTIFTAVTSKALQKDAYADAWAFRSPAPVCLPTAPLAMPSVFDPSCRGQKFSQLCRSVPPVAIQAKEDSVSVLAVLLCDLSGIFLVLSYFAIAHCQNCFFSISAL